MSRKLSLSVAWEQTKGFMRREGSLVFPVAFATFGIAFILMSLIMPQPNEAGEVEGDLWALAALPLIFFLMVGQIAIAYLALRPGVSVRDALAASMKRLPTMIGVAFLLIGGLTALMLLLSIPLALIGAATGVSLESTTALVALALLLFMTWLAARLMMLWPLLADTREGVMASIKQSFRMSKPYFWRFLVVVLASIVLTSVLMSAVQVGLGSILLIFGRLLGAENAAMLLTIVIVALLSAAIQAFVAVFLANIYRQLTAPLAPTGA